MTMRSQTPLVLCTTMLFWLGGCGPQWQPLFDGQTLDGWRQTGSADWTVEDGILVGRHGPERVRGNLLTEKEYGDFELSVTFRAVWPANSGIWFRYDDEHRTAAFQ